MGAEQKTHFLLDKNKCTKCGRCINTCSGMVLAFGPDGYPEMKAFERFGWRGCWKCQHCLAVCPQGAISIFDKKAEDSLPPPPPEMGRYMEQLVVNRRSCRRYLDRDVDPKIISRILDALSAAPTGGNSCNVEYTVIDDKERVREIWRLAYSKMESDAKQHIYTHSFSDFYYGKMKQSERTVRKNDLLFYGAPLVLFVTYDKTACWTNPHSGESSGLTDATIVATHMMLEAASLDLGTVWISYFDKAKARELLCLPENWQPVCMLYIGYPAVDFLPNTKLGCHRKPLEETCFFNEVPVQ